MSVTVNMTASKRARLKVLGWVAIASMLALVILGPTAGGVGAITATTYLHQAPPISSNAPGYEDEDCGELDAGTVLWHFVLVQTDAGVPGSQLHASFASAGDITVDAYKKSGGVLHFNITTGTDTLTGAHTNRAGRWLNLSHICVGPPLTTTTSTTTTSSSTTTVSSSTATNTTASGT